MLRRRTWKFYYQRVGMWVLAAVFALVAMAQTAAAEEQPADECIHAQLSTWTAQEAWVWNKLCLRQEADLTKAEEFGAAPNVETGEGWPDSRILRSEYIAQILGTPKYAELLGERSIVISGARYPETINLDDLKVSGAVYFWNSRFESGISLI